MQILQNKEPLPKIEGNVLRLRRVFKDEHEDITTLMVFSSRSNTQPNFLPVSIKELLKILLGMSPTSFYLSATTTVAKLDILGRRSRSKGYWASSLLCAPDH